MSSHSKRYKEALAKVDREQRYEVEDAVDILKSLPSAQFDETVEISVQLGIDPRKSDQQVRSSITLPHGTGRTTSVAVFAEGTDAERARDAGADFVGSDDLVKKVEGGWTDFDVALATPSMMQKIGRLGRFLGPRGLMPTPKNGTVREDVDVAVKEFKAGKVELRNDDTGNIHAPVGKLSFSAEKLVDNIHELIEHLRREKPPGASGRYLRNIVLTSTMGPGVKIKL
jgi:large subunit ribosomal protein L1